ncbi:hypothetical protein BJY01DRAFT_229565 [Aspergillus pseudoustus]|uniref:Zn(2)-C6 fungal-type domain-containing protein n=1 Tax=Aspergillus pseudoustus TaxID=1810923 RepID=A0ABR4IG59_9EURO
MYIALPILTAHRDSLLRHERGHEENVTAEGHRTIFTRVSRACTNCSKSKVRCDGESPCKYCSTRNLDCTPTVHQRKRYRRNPPPTAWGDKERTLSPSPDVQPLQPTVDSQEVPSFPTPFSGMNSGPDESDTVVPSQMRPPGRELEMQGSEDPSMYPNDSISSDMSFLPLQDWGFQYSIADWMSWEIEDSLPSVNPQFAAFPALGGFDQVQASSAPYHGTAEHGQYSTNLDPESRPKMTTQPWPNYYQNRANEVLVSHAACSADTTAGATPSDPTGKSDLLGERKTFISFPQLEATDFDILHAENYGHTPPLSVATYNSLFKSVKEICMLQKISDAVKISLFPPHTVFHTFIQLYFEYFEKLFPIIHRPNFNPSKSHWVELLAMATIGGRYSRSPGARACVQALAEVFRLSVFHIIELDRLSVRNVWLTRVMVLDVIGTIYSGDKRLLEIGLTILSAVVMQCRHNGYLKRTAFEFNAYDISDRHGLEKAWEAWSREEGCRRLAYGVWILQCQLTLNFDIASSMRVNEFLKPLPCHEDVWEAPNPETWLSRLRERSSGVDTPGLSAALSTVIRKEPLPSGIGGFGRLAMVHAIHQTTFDLRSFFTNPLMLDLTGSSLDAGLALRTWQARVFELLELLTPVDPPRALELTLHHNSSWALQSNFITTAHHVRLLTFTPIGDIFLFVSPRSDPTDRARVRESLLEWVAHDNGQDARRAVLSACIIFTMTRLRPSQSFHESIPFFMATLAIWIYNHLVHPTLSHMQEQPSSTTASGGGGVARTPITLRLDQVLTVQDGKAWIESDAGTVRGYLADVGSVHDHSAGKRLLAMGHQVLLSMHSWGPSRGFANFLTTLLDIYYS